MEIFNSVYGLMAGDGGENICCDHVWIYALNPAINRWGLGLIGPTSTIGHSARTAVLHVP